MAAAAPQPLPPAVGAALAASPPRPKQRRSLLGFISTKGCTHALKLRHSFKLDARTRLELGLDFDVLEDHALRQMLHSAAPWAAMLYQLDPEDKHAGAVEMTPQWVTYNRRFRLGREGAWWSVPFDAKLGATFSGSPHIEIGLLNAKLAAALALGLLAAGAPLSVKRKEVGGLAVHLALGRGASKRDFSLQERLEVDACLQRQGRGLKLDFSRIDGVLRLREDD